MRSVRRSRDPSGRHDGRGLAGPRGIREEGWAFGSETERRSPVRPPWSPGARGHRKPGRRTCQERTGGRAGVFATWRAGGIGAALRGGQVATFWTIWPPSHSSRSVWCKMGYVSLRGQGGQLATLARRAKRRALRDAGFAGRTQQTRVLILPPLPRRQSLRRLQRPRGFAACRFFPHAAPAVPFVLKGLPSLRSRRPRRFPRPAAEFGRPSGRSLLLDKGRTAAAPFRDRHPAL